MESVLTQPVNLSEAQEGLWFAQSLDPQNPVFNTAKYRVFNGVLEIDTFENAVNQAMREASALNVRVIETDLGPTQVLSGSPVRLEIVNLNRTHDIAADATDDNFKQALAQIAEDSSRPLDLAIDSPVCQKLFIVSDSCYVWYERIHHVVVDGYGISLLNNRIADLYNSAVSGTAQTTKPFSDFEQVVLEDQAYRSSEKRIRDHEFWLEKFSDKVEVGQIGQGAANISRSYIRSSGVLSSQFLQEIQNKAEALDIPWPDVLTALCSAYVKRLSLGTETVVGIPSMNRMGSRSANVPCMAMNVIPLIVKSDFSNAPDANSICTDDYITEIANQLKKSRRYAKYRSEQLRRDLGLVGEGRRLYGALINVLPFDDEPVFVVPSRTTILSTGPVEDLTFNFRIVNESANERLLLLEVDGNPDLYSSEDISEHHNRSVDFITRALNSNILTDIPTLTARERQLWINDLNDTDHSIPSTTLWNLLAEAQILYSDRIAVQDIGRQITYRQLAQESLIAAQALRAAGVGKGDIVGIGAPRSVELMIALVAVLSIGAAYLPFDTTHPQERINSIFESAKPKIVLTDIDDVKSLLSDGFKNQHGVSPSDLSKPAIPEADIPVPSDAAYIIYTSGSTGTPKGVVIEHLAIVNRLLWMKEHYSISPCDNILQKTPLTFDVSVWELFLPLISGATLTMSPPESHKDPAWLSQLIKEYKISTLHFVPSMLAAFLSEPKVSELDITRVFCSGEALPASLRDRFHSVLRNTQLHNLYGPTEAAVDVTYWNASKDDTSSPLPIGMPVWNTQMYVLDDNYRSLPPEIVGHLYIGGVQLAREYLGQPELTNQRFVYKEILGGSGTLQRIYQTGDLAYIDRSGAIIYVGRSDHQVKLRGFRIELGDIEAAIHRSSNIDQAHVIVREDYGSPELTAYFTAKDSNSQINIELLKAQLSKLVPEYMIPTHFIQLSDMPITSNGKLDRTQLPAPFRKRSESARRPKTETEIKLASIFSDVLELDEQVYTDDNFFALGGHSLLGAKLMVRVRENWNCDLRLGAIFANPTVARLANQIDRAFHGSGSVGLEPVIQLSENGGPRLFCIHPAGGISWCYGPISRELKNATVFGLQSKSLNTVHAEESLVQLASDYVSKITEIDPNGPYNLLGWSVGGIIAQEMACQLQQRGKSINFVAMLDSYPSDMWRDEPDPDEASALKALMLIAGFDPDSHTEIDLTKDSVIRFLRESNHPLGDLTDADLTGVMRSVETNARLVRRHRHNQFDGKVLHFRAGLDHAGKDLSTSMWKPYVTHLVELSIPSLHAYMTSPRSSQIVAHELNKHLITF